MRIRMILFEINKIMNLNKIRKILCTLSGDDYSIISRCTLALQVRFAMIGLFVGGITLLCFFSSYFTFNMLFDKRFIAVVLGLIFAGMIATIYLLLLYTLSKNVLPHKAKAGARIFSISIRVLFIAFIAVVISKPIERIFYSAAIDEELSNYKTLQISKYETITENSFSSELKELKDRIIHRYRINGYQKDDIVLTYEKQLRKKEQQKRQLVIEMRRLVSNSNFYIQSLIFLNKEHPTCWIITLIVILIFLSPAYLKYLVSEHSHFNDFRKQIEMQMVLDEYRIFKIRYAERMLQNFQMKVEYSECYTDPPFNTDRKKDERSFLSEDDLINDFYNG